MSLGSNTLTIMIGATPKELKRINQDNYSAQYYLRESTQEFTVNVRHSRENVLKDGTRFDRHNVELVHSVFPTETTPGQERIAYAVFRNKRTDDYEAVQESFYGLDEMLSQAGTMSDLLSWVS